MVTQCPRFAKRCSGEVGNGVKMGRVRIHWEAFREGETHRHSHVP